jgi:phosphoribosylformylglycinamidine synthase subunit PurS
MAIAEIHVTLKPTLLDPQGTTVTKALRQLGHEHVRDVRIGKFITVDLDDTLTDATLQAQLELMCRQLLANPVIEDYDITLPATPGAAGFDPLAAAPAAPVVAAAAEPPAAASAAPLAPAVSDRDVVPHPQPTRSVASAAPGAGPAHVTAPHISAPQLMSQGATAASTEAAAPLTVPASAPAAMPEAARAGTTVASGNLVAGPAPAADPTASDPFALDYRAYDAMTTDRKLAVQARAWQERSGWILNEINARRAAWILCVGGRVLESGATIDSYPSDEHLARLGASHDLVPWVFTRPPA